MKNGMKCGGKVHKKGYAKGGMAKKGSGGMNEKDLMKMGRNMAKAKTK